MTAAEYFALEIDSYSSLKLFDDDRNKYYKKFIEKKEVEDEDSPFLTKGSLVDILYFSPQDYDKNFALATSTLPTAQMLDFVKALWKRTVECLDESTGEITRDFDVIAKEAYNDVKYDFHGNPVAFKNKTFEKVIDTFNEGVGVLYYNQLRSSYGKTVIELATLQQAEKTVLEIKTNWVTKDICSLKTSKDVEVFDQLIIFFEFKGYPLKSMLDKVILNHIEKTIYIWDLKTCWNNEGEFKHNYLKYKYYLQAAVYYMAVLNWAEKEGWKDYKIVPMQYIVADTANARNPLIYKTTVLNLQEGLQGFTLSGKWHKGMDQLVEDLKWHKETNIWEISKENFDNKGIVEIKPFTEHGN